MTFDIKCRSSFQVEWRIIQSQLFNQSLDVIPFTYDYYVIGALSAGTKTYYAGQIARFYVSILQLLARDLFEILFQLENTFFNLAFTISSKITELKALPFPA